jgi:hypothetical protein
MSIRVSFLGDLFFGALQLLLEAGPFLRPPWSSLLMGAMALACFIVAGGAIWADAFVAAAVFGAFACFMLAGACFDYLGRTRSHIKD